MKTFVKILFLFAVASWSVACQDDNQDVTENILAPEEAAEIVGISLASGTEGATQQMAFAAISAEAMIEEAENAGGRLEAGSPLCGFDTTATFSKSNAPSADISFDYSFTYSYSFSCNSFNVPNSLQLECSQTGQVDVRRWSSDDESAALWTLSGLELSAPQYVFNGSFTREGSQISKVREQQSFMSELTLSFSDVLLDKQGYTVQGGTGSFSLTGSSTGGGDFSVNGSVAFIGNGTAEITINGEVYTVGLQRGEILEGE